MKYIGLSKCIPQNRETDDEADNQTDLNITNVSTSAESLATQEIVSIQNSVSSEATSTISSISSSFFISNQYLINKINSIHRNEDTKTPDTLEMISHFQYIKDMSNSSEFENDARSRLIAYYLMKKTIFNHQKQDNSFFSIDESSLENTDNDIFIYENLNQEKINFISRQHICVIYANYMTTQDPGHKHIYSSILKRHPITQDFDQNKSNNKVPFKLNDIH